MSVLFFAHSVGVVGGAERVTLSIINDIDKHHECHMLAPNEGELGVLAEKAGASYHPIACKQPEKTKPLTTFKQFLDYRALVKKYRPALVHTGDLLAVRSLQPVCQFYKIPLVCHVHFPYELSFMKWALQGRYAPAAFVFCSQELQHSVGEDLKQLCPRSLQQVIHNGIDINRFKPSEREKAPTAIKHIGIVANLQQRKGHDDFLEMAAILLERNLPVHFDIIGGDILQAPREPILKEKARALCISENVTFHGQLSDVRQALSSLDILVCASHEEAFPISILEAMACEIPIVSTDVNGIPEAIDSGVEGVLVPAHAPQQLALAVEAIVVDEEKGKRLAKAAREKVTNQFSNAVFAYKIEQLYKTVLEL